MFIVPTLNRTILHTGLMSRMNGLEKELIDWVGTVNNRTVGAGFSALEEKDGVWEVTIDVPGVTREQLTINIDGRRVHIETKEDASRKYSSAFMLPAEVDPAASEAKLELGILALKLARKVEDKSASMLEIQ